VRTCGLRLVRLIVLGALVVSAVTLIAGTSASHASADTTDPGSLVGEGGTFLEPIINKLVNDDSATVAPLIPTYLNVDLDQGIADFIGTGAGQFGTDYAVSERPLTTAETQTATSDGRSFAYVPFAATPVAIATLVPSSTYTGGPISTADLCPHIDLTVDQLGDLFGYDPTQVLSLWTDSRLPKCADNTALGGAAVSDWANLDPTMENEALMALLDSDPTSKASFDSVIGNASTAPSIGLVCQDLPVTNCDVPYENWPVYPEKQIAGGDETFLSHVIGIDPQSNAPSTDPTKWILGATFPISSIWTGSPLGVAWDIPTAAVQNAQGAFVTPSPAAAAAAEKDAKLNATTSSETNNVVTFNANATDATAYNNFLMVEDYLVVPMNGLPANKASALAQLVRFVLGTKGQSDISSFGAAPATAAMVTAGLKVAAQLNAEALSPGTTTSSTTTTTTSPTTTTTSPGTTTTTTTGGGVSGGGPLGGGASGSTSSVSTAGDTSSDGGAGTSSGSLAFTGATVWPLTAIGATLVVVAETFRRRFRRRRAVA
jgi:ABC-type phosphate transport system substrate-binding protein